MEILQFNIGIFVFFTAFSSAFAQQCPSVINECSCTYTNEYVDELICDDLGHLQNVPRFYASTTDIIPKVTIGSIDNNVTIISSIQSNAFDGLRTRILHLRNNGIDSIDKDAFQGLGPWIESLFIDGNNLADLDPDTFSTLTELVHLNLRRNHLSTVNGQYFQGLVKLQTLVMDNNEFESFPMDTFQNLGALRSLDLDENELVEIPYGLFKDLVSLEKVNLAYNSITSVANDTFANMPNLDELSLKGNQISELDPELFRNNRALDYLDLSYNNLGLIPTGFFLNSIDVSYLNFGFNDISVIEASAFTLMRQLEYLFLRDNEIRSIPRNAFENLIKLLSLDLQSNHLQRLENGLFAGLGAVTELYLQYNEIDTMDTGVFDPLGAVKIIDLSGNRISVFPDNPFSSCRNLQNLILYDNTIREIRADLLRSLTNLEYLYLQINNIRAIEAGSFDSLENVVYLDLSKNWLTEIPAGVFQSMSNLEELVLSRNPIFAIDSIFAGLSSLTVLHLNNSCFNSIPNNLEADLVSIETIYMRHNNVSAIEYDDFRGMTSLRNLDLAFCNIKFLEWNAFGNELEYIDITGNPIVCDCSNSWLRYDFIKFASVESMVCADPQETVGYYTVCYPRDSCPGSSPGQANRDFCASTPRPPSGVPAAIPNDGIYVDETVCDLTKYPGLLESSTTIATPPSDFLSNLTMARDGDNLVMQWNALATLEDEIERYYIEMVPNPNHGNTLRYESQSTSMTIPFWDITENAYEICISASFTYGPLYNDLLCTALARVDYTTTTTTQPTTPEDLTTVTPEPQSSSKDNNPLSLTLTIVVAAAGALLLIIVTILIVCCTRRSSSSKDSSKGSLPPPYSSFDDPDMDMKTHQLEMAEQSTLSWPSHDEHAHSKAEKGFS